MTAARVLVVGRVGVELPGIDVRCVAEAPLDSAVSWRPDCIVLDSRDPARASAGVAELRSDFRTRDVPIVHLVSEVSAVAGDDDFVLWPAGAIELQARVQLALRRAAERSGRNPLTGLPGNRALVSEIVARQVRGEPFECVYVDIDGFKAFNDVNGFVRGDEVIAELASCILAALDETPPGECFVGHLGGDDFVVLGPPGRAASFGQRVNASFDACSLTIATVVGAEAFTDARSVAQAAAAAKAQARSRSHRDPA